MDRGTSSPLLSWMLLPVTAALILSALSLPHQPYAGLVLRGDRVWRSLPGGPAERAGLAPGDRLVPLPGQPPFTRSPLAYAAPGEPMVLLRERGQRPRHGPRGASGAPRRRAPHDGRPAGRGVGLRAHRRLGLERAPRPAHARLLPALPGLRLAAGAAAALAQRGLGRAVRRALHGRGPLPAGAVHPLLRPLPRVGPAAGPSALGHHHRLRCGHGPLRGLVPHHAGRTGLRGHRRNRAVPDPGHGRTVVRLRAAGRALRVRGLLPPRALHGRAAPAAGGAGGHRARGPALRHPGRGAEPRRPADRSPASAWP